MTTLAPAETTVYPSRVTAADLIQRALVNHRHKTALIQGDRRVTYAEFGDRIHRAVNALDALGVRPGEPVGLVAGNIIEFLEVDFACLMGGYVRCAETPRLHPNELIGIFASASIRVVIVEESYLERFETVAAKIPTLEKIVVIGNSTDHTSWDDLLQAASATPPEATPTAGTDGWLIYSSGTTGEPKGSTLTQGSIVGFTRNVLAEICSLDETDVLLHSAPLGHFSGCLAFASLYRGGTQVLLPNFDAEQLLRTVAEHHVTHTVLVPTMLATLTNTARTLGIDVSSLEYMIYGASSIALSQLTAAIETFGNVLVQVYGLTENPMPVTVLPRRAHIFDPDGPAPQRLRSAGRPVAAVEVRLVDDDRHDVPTGSRGEIALRADVRMHGYWGRPDLTAAVFDDDGWFYTGDVGQFDEDGYLYMVDRKKDMIVTGGFNVYPTEVENVIDTVPGVSEVAVVGLPDEQWGEAVTAVVVADRTAENLTAADVIAAVRAQLAGYKCPKRVEFVDELPKSSRGKVLRRRLREQFSEHPGPNGAES
ncbi:AMP-binding protein [Rhodococcus sp. IEGM 1354]|uniref:class I adenylate-forming enzyme family protein n=1 Tax=Rhodococcus sp. IEGM 1354 TaxID=3047088 RepID=UPI0024B71CE9|nr:AMP-binding protein [Rhodococcus sp. IEGM 1354]MDI9933238.1 AMP-binding protein [Rhodococcus sp. IEGM 1354]